VSLRPHEKALALMNVVTSVVANDLCSGCGVCAGVCQHDALTMLTRSNGDLAVTQAGACHEKCDLCLRICPFADGVHQPRELSTELFGPTSDYQPAFDNAIGWYRRCFVGFSNVDEHRIAGASGGLVTWCLGTLVADGLIDKVAVVGRAEPKSDLLFEFKAVDSVEQVRQAAGSVYYPVEISGLIREMIAEPATRWAVVGVPCLCAALRRAMINVPRLGQSVRYILGIACGMYQNMMYTELLLSKSGLRPCEVGDLTYRKKRSEGPANDYGFHACDREGSWRTIIPYRPLPYFLGRNAYFRYNACNYCMDVFAEAADACFMDAWLPEYVTDPQGTSIVVLRSSALEQILLAGRASGELQLEDIPADRVVLSQRGHVRRKQELIEMRLSPRQAHRGQMVSANWKDRIDWWLQRRTQERSKRAWAKYGRRYGVRAFWLAMADLALAQVVLWRFLPRVLYLSRRAAGKMMSLFRRR